MNYKQHEIVNDKRSYNVQGFFGKNGFKSIKAAKEHVSSSIEEWIEENDNDDTMYAFVSGRLYRYANNGQFQIPNNLHRAGSCSFCFETDFYIESTPYDYRG